MRHTIPVILLTLFVSSCAPPRVTPKKLHAHYRAHAMEKLNHMAYMGSKGKYHYFHHYRISMMKREYRVLKDKLPIDDPFPLTEDKSQWRSYMVMEDESRNSGVALISCRDISRNFEGGSPLDINILAQP